MTTDGAGRDVEPILDRAGTLVAVVELGLGSWLIASFVSQSDRQLLKKRRSDPDALRHRCGDGETSTKPAAMFKQIVLAFAAGPDGCWRWGDGAPVQKLLCCQLHQAGRQRLEFKPLFLDFIRCGHRSLLRSLSVKVCCPQ
jgi:hypothetical protein